MLLGVAEICCTSWFSRQQIHVAVAWIVGKSMSGGVVWVIAASGEITLLIQVLTFSDFPCTWMDFVVLYTVIVANLFMRLEMARFLCFTVVTSSTKAPELSNFQSWLKLNCTGGWQLVTVHCVVLFSCFNTFAKFSTVMLFRLPRYALTLCRDPDTCSITNAATSKGLYVIKFFVVFEICFSLLSVYFCVVFLMFAWVVAGLKLCAVGLRGWSVVTVRLVETGELFNMAGIFQYSQ